jgi:hypothetical protein
MIYGFLFNEDPDHSWNLYLKGYEWGPSSLPLIISHENIWPGIPQHQTGLFKACHQTQIETRPFLMNTGKDNFECWGINALDWFTQTYAHVQLTSLILVAELESEVVKPSDSHSSDLDSFLVLFQDSRFPQLNTMKLVTKDWREDFDILDGQAELETHLDILRVIINGFVNRLHDIVKSRNMELGIYCMTWGFEHVLVPTVLSTERIEAVGW